jgi:signal transduction histidine kinase
MSISTEDMAWLDQAPPEETKRIVEALYRVHRLIAVITDLNLLLEQIMEESKAVARAEASSLLLYDPESQELYFKVALGEQGDQKKLMREVRLKRGQGIAGAAAEGRRSIIVPNVQLDDRFYREADSKSSFQTRNILAVPMFDRDELIGVIEVLNKIDDQEFKETDLRVMEMFSGLAGSAIANARLIESNLRKERLAAIGQAVAGLSHYTKNIITSMSGGADLVEQGIRQQQLAIVERAWPVLRRSTRRISHVVQDMLSYSRSREPLRQDCDLREILEDVRSSFHELFAQRQVCIEVVIDGLHEPVHVDGNGVYRCLLNLLTNAADAVSDNGGRVEIRASLTPEDMLYIDVLDNGPGVPLEARELVFEPFFTTKGTRGTGLGLAVSRKIAREHGGDLTIEDAPGGGARFILAMDTSHVVAATLPHQTAAEED